MSQEKYVPRPKHPSPRKPLFSTLPLQATHCQLGGGEELQLLTESEISSFLHPTLDELRKSLKLQQIMLMKALALMIIMLVFLRP